MNPSQTDPVHLLQIWIMPEKNGLEPSYEQKSFPESEKRAKLRVIASRDGREGSVKINQDAQLFVSLLLPGEEVTHEFQQNRHGWLQIAKGAVELNGLKLEQGDGAAISAEDTLTIRAAEDSEILLFDLA
jgi:quercetin 2,3-dioxygenase